MECWKIQFGTIVKRGAEMKLSLLAINEPPTPFSPMGKKKIFRIFMLRIWLWLLVVWMLQKDHQAIDILLAEIDIYELFAFKHCKGRKAKLALCEGSLILFNLLNVCSF